LEKITRDFDGMGQSRWRFLWNIGELDAETISYTRCLTNFRAGIADHDPDLVNACVADRFDDSKQHGFVGNWNQLFCPCIRQWIEARPLASTEDQSLHVFTSPP